MKILAFSDSHGDEEAMSILKKKAKDVDLVICCGDITFFGRDLNKIVKQISKLHKRVYIIHGNHESPNRVKQECAKYKNVKFCHKKVYKLPEFTLFGYGGEGFCETNEDFADFIDKNKDKLEDTNVLITHQPPYNTVLDEIGEMHVGCRTVKKYVKFFNMALSGHIHDSQGHNEVIKKTFLMNLGPDGEIINLENGIARID